METLRNGFTLETAPGGFPLSSDSILLSDFVKLPKDASVLDLGSGSGTLGLLLCAKDPRCSVTGLELDRAAHEAALGNLSRNGLTPRMKSICADLRCVPSLFPAGCFHCCVSNPPYFSGGFSSQTLPLARQDSCCSMSELFGAAAWALKFGGDFFLVHKPERLGELFVQAAQFHLEPKRLRLVRHRPGSEISLVLIAFRKGAKPGLKWEELCLFHEDGTPTEAYRKIYHI